MKDSTRLAKLNELLGIPTEVVQKVEQEKQARKGNVQGITEDEIQSFREAQGIIYFLQAPALFTAKTCKHCDASYLVSRLYVAYCSYTCIRLSLEEQGIVWRKNRNQDIESLVAEVYEGNEPIWVRNLNTLEAAILKLKESAKSQQIQQLGQATPSS